MRETHEKSKIGHVERKRFPFNVACFVILARHPSSGPGCARSTFPVGEGFLRRGRRTEVLRIYAPVPPGRLRPSSGPGYARSTFPVGEGDLPAGEGCLPAGEGDLRRGNLKIQLCRQISVDVVADGLFLQDSGYSYLGSFRNPSP